MKSTDLVDLGAVDNDGNPVLSHPPMIHVTMTEDCPLTTEEALAVLQEAIEAKEKAGPDSVRLSSLQARR